MLWQMSNPEPDRRYYHPFESMISPMTCLFIDVEKLKALREGL